MSKYVKQLLTDDLRERFRGVSDALLVNMVGLEANAANRLRADLRDKGINILVVKNSLAARATEGTPLATMFEGVAGSSAVCWGASDIVALAKEITKLARDAKLEAFQTRGGVLDGERLSAEEVERVSKWPSREEQLSIVVGQILGPGARLAGQLLGPGGALASQIKQRGESEESEKDEVEEPAAAGAEASSEPQQASAPGDGAEPAPPA